MITGAPALQNVLTHQNYSVSAIIKNNCSATSKLIMNSGSPEKEGSTYG